MGGKVSLLGVLGEGVEAGVQRAGRGGLRLRAPGFGSGRAQLRASAPVWNGHAGRACSRVSPTRLTYYRTLVVSDLQTFPHPIPSLYTNFHKFVGLEHDMCALYDLEVVLPYSCSALD